MQATFAAIGRAVFFAQIFETSLIQVFEIFKKNTDEKYLEAEGSAVSASKFKFPIVNVIKFLSSAEKISPKLQKRLEEYVEDRHVLIHRYVHQNGLPDLADEQSFAGMVELANRVESEARSLSLDLIGYLMSRLESVTENPGDAEWFRQQIGEIFTQADCE